MIVEVYRNRTRDFHGCIGHPTARWSPHPRLLVGGSINPNVVEVVEPTWRHLLSDWNHLRDDLGVRAVLNCETEQSDAGKGVGMALGEFGIVDNSRDYHGDVVRAAVEWARDILAEPGILYVHCHMGGGRSAAIAYAILRDVFGQDAETATASIQGGKDWAHVWAGQVVGGSILEYPNLQWAGAPSMGSYHARLSVESAITSS